ncbi:MAG: exosortase/archaeosortase family protein [Chthonomonas sp.]|nr:exosortase/archaeosortase family protein [Chthonomonas sp.]
MSEIAADSTDVLPGTKAKKGLPGLPDFDFNKIRNSPAFIPGLVAIAALVFAFWELFAELPKLWFKDDGYYSHGVLVPFISAYVIYRWWPKLKDIPVRPFYPAVLPLLLTGWLLFAGVRIGQIQILSFSLVMMLLAAVWFVAGGRWLLATFLPIGFLLFGLPIWSAIIDTYTNPLQIISTDISFSMLQLVGFEPWKQDNTTIYLKNFTLDVGVPCSGLKLAIAVSAFTSFFMMIAKLKWWGNLIMVAAVLPLCLFINGLRITLIGVVGNLYGEQAGHDFHDYSGYITLIVCFFLLFKLARLLGWED